MEIGSDPWVSTPVSFLPVSPFTTETRKCKVAELIDQWAGTGFAERIQSLFLPHKAETILGIPLHRPLHREAGRDVLIWLWDSKDCFSVKSVYQVALNMLSEHGGLGSSFGNSFQ